MNAQRTYDASKLTGYLLANFKRFGGLTAQEIDRLYENGPAAATASPAVNVDHIVAAFAAARRQGTQYPRMRVEGFTFKAAANSDGIHIIENRSGFDEYLGSIYAGAFKPTRTCTEAQRQAILKAVADPLAAMVAFGKKFGKCSVCGRKLSDPESIKRAIGPICAEKFGFGV